MRHRASGLALAILLVATAPVPAARAADDAGPLVVVGSGNMAGFLRSASQRFSLEQRTRVSVEARTSSAGPPALLRGRAGVASMSRPMNAEELEAFRAVLGGEPEVVSVAIDAVGVYVNEENPLRELTLEQVDAIFSAQRRCGAPAQISRWEQLGLEGAWAGREIGLYGHVPSSGTHAFFRQRALCGGPFRPGVRSQPGARSVILSIAESAFGMGYAARADLRRGVRTLAIAEVAGGHYGTISAEDVYAGHYPLARDLLLYRRPAADDDPQAALARAFVAHMLSDAGQQYVERAGYLKLPADRLALERAKLAR